MANACCSVLARLNESDPAAFDAVWFAELDPPNTDPPAIVTGTFALTAFCFASASAFAFWNVSAFWPTAWN